MILFEFLFTGLRTLPPEGGTAQPDGGAGQAGISRIILFIFLELFFQMKYFSYTFWNCLVGSGIRMTRLRRARGDLSSN